MSPRVLLAAASLLAVVALPPTGATSCSDAHQGLGEVHGEPFGTLFVVGVWTECANAWGCGDAASGSTHGLEGFPMGPMEVTELFDTAFGCIVECSFPAFGLAYRGPGGFVEPGVNEYGERIVTFDCPGGFHGEMRENAF